MMGLSPETSLIVHSVLLNLVFDGADVMYFLLNMINFMHMRLLTYFVALHFIFDCTLILAP
jgi:hypothetical protein